MITGEELVAVGRGAAIIGVSLTIGMAFIAPEAVPMVGLLAKIVRNVDKGEKFEKAIVAAGKLEKAIESLPAGLKVQRVRAGVDSERVAIVGRSMGDADRGLIGVNDTAAHFEAQGIKVETFKPTKEANE